MINKQNDLIRRATEKIKRDEKCKKNCYAFVGPTGPTGPTGGAIGPTGTSGTILNYAIFMH